MQAPSLVRQTKGPHPPTYKPLKLLLPEASSALIGIGIILGKPLRGLFDQQLQFAPIQGYSRCFRTGRGVWVELGPPTKLDEQFHPDPYLLQENKRRGVHTPLWTDTLIFERLSPLDGTQRVSLGSWTLDIVDTTEAQMISKTWAVAPLPKQLSLSGPSPVHLNPVHLARPLSL